jgi:hypothetical protein
MMADMGQRASIDGRRVERLYGWLVGWGNCGIEQSHLFADRICKSRIFQTTMLLVDNFLKNGPLRKLREKINFPGPMAVGAEVVVRGCF